MITFRCTKKTRELFGIGDHNLTVASDDAMSEWFVDTATIGRRRCLLFTHKVTLYSFWVPAFRRYMLVNLEGLFAEHLLATLIGDGFDENDASRLLGERGIRFAKTDNRAVTGSMNDHIFRSRMCISSEGGVINANFKEINRHLNNTPMGALGVGSRMDFPIDVLRKILRPNATTARIRNLALREALDAWDAADGPLTKNEIENAAGTLGLRPRKVRRL